MGFNILFTSVGRRVSLVRHFRKVLSDLQLEGNLVGADVALSAPAMHVVDKKYVVCRVSDKYYIPELLDICRTEDIDLLIPLIDTELLVLAQNKELFEQVSARVLVSTPGAVKIAMDKHNTHRFLTENGFAAPEVFNVDEALARDDIEYPLVMKPAKGSASMGVTVIENKEDLECFKDKITNSILQEYLDGYEHTLDVLVDFNGKVRCVVPRKRLEVRAGEVSKGVTVKDERIIMTGKRVVEALKGALGPITVQGFLTNDGKFKLTEINPRFGGGHPLAIVAGADYPRWIIEMMLGRDSKIRLDGWEDGVVMLRYDEAIFTKRQDIEC
jgi:carbamoyl-phosphate synthase large subunit